MSETKLVKGVLQALQLRGVLAWRTNAGAVVVRSGKSEYVVRGAPAGTPDVLLVIGKTGRLGGIELKTEAGRQRATQKRWQERAERHGVRYGIARSISESLALVDRWVLAESEGGRV